MTMLAVETNRLQCIFRLIRDVPDGSWTVILSVSNSSAKKRSSANLRDWHGNQVVEKRIFSFSTFVLFSLRTRTRSLLATSAFSKIRVSTTHERTNSTDEGNPQPITIVGDRCGVWSHLISLNIIVFFVVLNIRRWFLMFVKSVGMGTLRLLPHVFKPLSIRSFSHLASRSNPHLCRSAILSIQHFQLSARSFRTSTRRDKRDYYDVLGVPRTANAREIKKAYYNVCSSFPIDSF